MKFKHYAVIKKPKNLNRQIRNVNEEMVAAPANSNDTLTQTTNINNKLQKL